MAFYFSYSTRLERGILTTMAEVHEVVAVHQAEQDGEVPVATRKIDPKDPPRFWDRAWVGMPDPAPYGPLDGHKGGIGMPAGEAAYAVKKDLKKQAGAEEEDDKDEDDKKQEKRKLEKPGGKRIGGNVQNGQNPLGL
ncbi:hypothetical protein LTR17_027575 [Elasticomyces elasticus]|nr:hypothetical protein LTR17_027575 [Elasticomyces elasticus]